MKGAIIILSDPQHAGKQSLGRPFTGLAAAYDFKHRGTEVAIYFQCAGRRWAGVVGDPVHLVHALYQTVADTVAGVCRGCADVFGPREDADKSGFKLITDNGAPRTSGLQSIAQLATDGYAMYSF
jgi:hypothetical protein